MASKSGKIRRVIRHKRLRKKLRGTDEKPRLSVYRSLGNIYAQVINDGKGVTLVSASSLEKLFMKTTENSKKEMAKKIGTEIAKRSLKKGIKSVAFDKGKYKYHGIIKIFADSARSAGLEF